MPVTRRGSYSEDNSGVGNRQYSTHGETTNYGNALPLMDTGYEGTQPVDHNDGENTSFDKFSGERRTHSMIEGVAFTSKMTIHQKILL